MAESHPRVFVSAPAVVSQAQRHLIDRWVEVVTLEKMHVVSLGRSDYVLPPWDQLRLIMSDVDGAVVLGLRQLHVVEAVWRPGTDEEQPVSGPWTSPWVQLEAGMAIASGLPLLAVSEEGISEGVFASEICCAGVYVLTADATGSPTVGDFVAEVGAYAQRRRRRYSQSH